MAHFRTIVAGVAVALSILSIARAQHVWRAGSVTYKCNTGTACITGDSTGSSTYGVLGFSAGSDAVHGLTHSQTGDSGVAGIADGASGSGQGVYGRSANGAGVYGSTSGGAYNLQNAAGISGQVLGSGKGDGVAGYGGGNGVYGNGAYGINAGGYRVALAAAVHASTDYIFGSQGPKGAYCLIDGSGNLTCTGTITQGALLRTAHRSADGQPVLTYASTSATATIEYSGTARISRGVASVQIDPAFASLMDRKWYYVFLTPLGDTPGLYVSRKTPTAFQVRESDRARSTLSFDYRIVANPLDVENDRLAPAIQADRRATGAAAAGRSVVRALRALPEGSIAYNCSSGTACVTGNSSGSKTYGVLGFSAGADGVHGITHSTSGNSGVSGIANSTKGHAQGVFGTSSHGPGVSGETSGAGDNGVEGHVLDNGTGNGVAGYGGKFGDGVDGGGDTGVFGETSGSTGTAVFAQADTSSSLIFMGVGAFGAFCQIDAKANLECSGYITGKGSARTRHRSSDGRRVLTYASQSAAPTIEDVGTARMSGGAAAVRIDPAFAATIDRSKRYYVFLTPLGNVRGLYVSAETPAGFVVREAGGGHESLAFDYRIVANPL